MTRERRRAALTMAGIGLALSLLCGWRLAAGRVDRDVAGCLADRGSGGSGVRWRHRDAGVDADLRGAGSLGSDGGVSGWHRDAPDRQPIAIAAMIAVVAALAGSWIFQSWAEQRLAEDGYVRCGAERTGRFASVTLYARKVDPV
ncbi:hypothetical protein [Sphingomonas panaciterrae]|uniref:hypothetical protein n=1 Tax=Sphingomonas panaciterrae TaxID=1462999 RepID=UPI002FF2D599